MKPEHVIEIKNLQVQFRTLDGTVRGVDDVTLDIRNGETLGLVGESGCGKSVTAHSIMRLLPKRVARISQGEIWFRRRNGDEHNLVQVDPEGSLIRDIRGNEIAMIFQEPMTSLSPMHTIGDQVTEAIMLHQRVSRKEAEESAIEMLTAVRIGNAREFIRSYPHQYSGGMRQRAMIAMALSCNPQVLIADEPTTALDVTIQAQILDLIKDLQKKERLSILLITHDLGVVAEVADTVGVMYASRLCEITDVHRLFAEPLHPYTVSLFKSLPRLGEKKERLETIPGSVPNPLEFPPGCTFHPRCFLTKKLGSAAAPADTVLVESGVEQVRVLARCAAEMPPLREVSNGHWCSCWECEGFTGAKESDPAEGVVG
jgi:oligopeptide/dipeptide ABC transporter ATP-binding protein